MILTWKHYHFHIWPIWIGLTSTTKLFLFAIVNDESIFKGNLKATSPPSFSVPAAEHCSFVTPENDECRHPSVTRASKPVAWQQLTADTMKTPCRIFKSTSEWGRMLLIYWDSHDMCDRIQHPVSGRLCGAKYLVDVGGLNGERREDSKRIARCANFLCAVAHVPGLKWRNCKWRDREGELIMEYGHKHERWVAFGSGCCRGNSPKFRPRQTQVG